MMLRYLLLTVALTLGATGIFGQQPDNDADALRVLQGVKLIPDFQSSPSVRRYFARRPSQSQVVYAGKPKGPTCGHIVVTPANLETDPGIRVTPQEAHSAPMPQVPSLPACPEDARRNRLP